MKVLHVAIGTYPTSENPIAGIFVKKLVEMQRSKGLDSRVINGINSWFGFLKSGFSLNAERFTFTNQRGISRLPKLVQERYFSRLSAAFKKQCNFMPDVIHCHFANNAPLGQKLSLEFDCPYVVTLHENHWWFEEIIINDAQKYMSAITGSDIITRPNSIDLIDLYKWNIPYEKLMYLPNYVDEDSFRISSEAERTRARNELRIRRDKVILNIASLDKNKGQELLIISTSVLKKKLPSFEVWIIGEGPEEKALRDLSAQLGVQEDIKFLGRVENNKLQSYLSCADVFAMPSKAESFGISQVEGMLAGIPVVATKNFGSEDIVMNGRNGFIASSRDPREYAKLLFEAVNKNWDHHDIRRSAVERFGGSAIYKIMMDLYTTAVKRYAKKS